MVKKSLLVSAAVMVALTSACSNGSKQEAKSDPGTAPQQSQQTQQPAQPAVSKDPVELVLYSTAATSEEEVKQKYSDPIQKQFPNIKIKYIKKAAGTNIDELVAAGQQIDIYYESVNFFNTVTTYQLGYDMTDLIKKHNIDVGAFEPTMIDYAKAMSKNGGIYGLPVFTQNVILFYNKDIFDKFGVPYPKNDMTWDDLQELAKKLNRNDGGKQYLGFASSPSHTLRANQYSLTFLDPKTDKATINTAEKWKQIYQTYYVTPSADPGFKKTMVEALKNKLPYKDPFLKDRNLAMIAYLSELDWAASGSEGMNWDIAALPTFKDLPGVGSSAYPFYWGVTAQSKHKDEAMEVIKFLTDKDYQTKQARAGTMTSLKDDAIKKQLGLDSKYKDKNLSAIFYNKYAPMPVKSNYEGDAQKAFEDATHEAALGNTDLNTLFRKIEEGANKAVDAVKTKK
ncbi:ABC transporter substrate-binding protein [Paenibacillus cremeus]|uniref:Extracellular solute-binding protein n=1 Tax=Paenibacillus cremeus TaxID=2163881 RepID=A0A559K4L4_9BACL|nr:extracellular solute-binding protein [Paenibacillus cremeus]TVY07085.1 extracellular solute-binding protein [Paenibacillus cremeus]